MRRIATLMTALLLAACGTDKKIPEGGTPVFGGANQSPAVKQREIKLDRPRELRSWESAAGPLDNNPGNTTARDSFRRLYNISIGSIGANNLSLYPPIIADGHIYTIDGYLRVSKFELKNGRRAWRNNFLKPHGEIVYGSIAFADGALYAASSNAEVIKIDAATNKLEWRTKLSGTLKGAIKVCGDRLLVMDGANKLEVLRTSDGATAFTKFFLDAPLGMIRGSTPACEGDVAIFGLQNGEIAAKNLATGASLWGARGHAGSFHSNNTITDIVASPVIADGKVVVKTFGGGMRALDLKTGRELWRASMSGRATPAISGGTIFDADDNNMLRAIDIASGREIWSTRIASAKDAGFAQSVLLLNNRAVVFMSGGRAFSFDPSTGAPLSTQKLASSIDAPVATTGGAVFVPSGSSVRVWQ
ncbi:MAG: PQQ-binding-like beta-propeller repeat protein [Alphaproteobacteria bacterium]|nr:PQQ-binding-like beta-propeller repeat protein [Alphaproteobacteria bacterium]